MLALKFHAGGRPGASLRPTSEPARDVEVVVRDGWRTIVGSKWMPGNFAYWIEKDLGRPVVNQARVVGDFDFDLRGRVGDIASVNAALAPYGLEVAEVEQRS